MSRSSWSRKDRGGVGDGGGDGGGGGGLLAPPQRCGKVAFTGGHQRISGHQRVLHRRLTSADRLPMEDAGVGAQADVAYQPSRADSTVWQAFLINPDPWPRLRPFLLISCGLLISLPCLHGHHWCLLCLGSLGCLHGRHQRHRWFLGLHGFHALRGLHALHGLHQRRLHGLHALQGKMEGRIKMEGRKNQPWAKMDTDDEDEWV